jgi:DNA-directed RNA polymerase specialized sigma24 family protein
MTHRKRVSRSYIVHIMYELRLYRLLLQDSQEAKEAAQEVFLKLLRASDILGRGLRSEGPATTRNLPFLPTGRARWRMAKRTL